MSDTLGPQIRALRTARKLTQKNLALMSGISQQHLSLLEMGRGGVEFATLRRILAALGHDIAFVPRPAVSALAARAKQWDVVAKWEAARERELPVGGSAAQAGALADFYLSRHGKRPTQTELRGHAERVRAWRELLARVRVR
ncbi:MAG: hypothetical protein A2X36_08455 [Elusimicrobia bacterium GWA2_69_24]|nr:MAG: hypothetical protein A2X36_08455 [Elusimicrobia bacterium GWA2_69_24]HBL16949.1 hypothetical protein [Elusimicrobiota bacterium]